MKKIEKIIICFLLGVILIFNGALLIKSKNASKEKKDNIVEVENEKSEILQKTVLAEKFIDNLPTIDKITVEDKSLITKAKGLVEKVKDLDFKAKVKNRYKLEALEKQIELLEQESLSKEKNEEEKTNNDKILNNQKAEESIKAKEKPQSNKPAASVPKKVKTTYEEKVYYEDINFEVQYVNDNSLNKGVSKVKSNGQLGQRKLVIKIKYENNQEVSRETVSNTVTKNPVNKVILQGTYVAPVVNTGGSNQMYSHINASRNSASLASLSRSSRLDKAAQIRAKEIVNNFSHTRPNGQPFYTVDAAIVGGENIAYGSKDPSLTHQRFMDSQGHRENVLRSSYRSVGVAEYKEGNGPTFWVVLFSKQ